MKKIVVAADSFKGSIGSKDIAAVFSNVAEKFDSVKVCGIGVSDGGEGTVDVLTAFGGFEKRTAKVKGPLGDEVEAKYAVKGTVAAIETAEAAGLTLIPFGKHNALKTTTYGVGELIVKAVAEGAKEILIFAGGSATNDGGAGALSAMGFEFIGSDGVRFLPTGGTLQNVSKVICAGKTTFDGVRFKVLSDVKNPLLGPDGATYVYGPQKGADSEDLKILERGMENFCAATEKATGVRANAVLGAGAAGGLAAGFAAYLGASIESGANYVLKLVGFYDLLDGADAVVTGEGKIDSQTLSGKIVSEIAAAAKRAGVPLYGIAGTTDLPQTELEKLGFLAVETLDKYAKSADDSIKNAKKYMYVAAKNLLEKIAADKNRRN